jgi:signal transduction histidine kinase
MPVTLPPGLDLSAYRIVQEALSNALKHAGDTSATVRVAYQPDLLLLDITNQPGTPPGGRVNGGHGIIGMRERAALFGGSLKAEPQACGGYKVQAAIPLPSQERT